MSLSAGEITAIIVGVGNFTAWGKLFYDMRKNGGNGKPCPMHTQVETRLATVEAERAGLSNELGQLHVENRSDHKQIFEDIKGLSIDIAGAAFATATAAAATATAAAAVASQRKR